MEMEDRLATAFTDIHDDAVIVESFVPCRLRDELEHPLCLIRREFRDLAERFDVPLRNDEQVRVGPRVDVADRDDARPGADVIAASRTTASVLRNARSSSVGKPTITSVVRLNS